MRLLLLLLWVAVHCSLLRTNQQQINILGTVQSLTRLFAHTFQGLTESLEREVVSQLYPDNSLDVQIQLDECESAVVDRTLDEMGIFDRDLRAFRLSCEAADPAAPITQLVQDAMQAVANIAAPCTNMNICSLGENMGYMDIRMSRC